MLKTATRADVRADVHARRAEDRRDKTRQLWVVGGSLRSQLNGGISLCQPPDAGYSHTPAALSFAASRD